MREIFIFVIVVIVMGEILLFLIVFDYGNYIFICFDDFFNYLFLILYFLL